MSRSLKHLLLTTIEDPSNLHSWSGIPYSLREALERIVERVTVCRPGPPSRNPVDVARRLWHGGKPPKYPLWMTDATLRNNARELAASIQQNRPDAVLSILAHPLVFLPHPGIPTFFFADSAFQSFHEMYRGVTGESVRDSIYARYEADVARRIDGVCLGSEWAVEDADKVFRAEYPEAEFRSRLHVTPLGANWVPGMSRAAVLAAADARPSDKIRLLFVGIDWVRKGGPLAVEIAMRLRDAGHRVHLDIVGCRPELPPGTGDMITVRGTLFRSNPEEAATLAALFLSAHFLLVPTMAECYGIVFAEAQAFALPPVSRAVGALPTVIQDGSTGLLFDSSATAAEYVERILALHADPAAYLRMASAARDRFETLLNWDKTAESIVHLMSLKLAAGE